MKIIIVGSNEVYSLEKIYINNLIELGVSVIHFPAQSIFINYYNKSIANKLIHKAGLSNIFKVINKQLLSLVQQETPDVVWVFKGMEIFPFTLKEIKKYSKHLVNYNPDNPFIFSGKGSGNRNVTESIGLYDLHFTYNHEVKVRLENEFNLKVALLPFGFEYSEEILKACIGQPEIKKMCFLGNPDPYRADFINQLIKAGFEMDIYGHGWEKFIDHSSAGVHDAVYNDEFWKVLRRYRIQLNYMRPHNLTSHNMRSFEIPGIGGIMLAPKTVDHETFFVSGSDVFLYDSFEDCCRKATAILNMDADEALKIRNAALHNSRIKGYDYKSRAKYVLEQLLNLNG